MTVLAAFQVLLSRYSGQADITVGTATAGRPQMALEPLIGFFVNTLVLRTRVDTGESFRELLRRVRQVTLGAYAHQDAPFEAVVEALQPERSLSHTPLFQVMFIWQNTPAIKLSIPGLELSAAASESGTGKFDLTVSLKELETELIVTVDYNTDLFEGQRIARLLSHYEQLLQGIAQDPDRLLSSLPLLSAAEREQQLAAWNDTGRGYPVVCIQELFEAQVARTPEAVALVFESQEFTFAELNRRANRLAVHLQDLGVGPETLVGICVQRSPEMLVGLLGILKAGGAYVPLDPAFPPARLAFMMEDASVPVLLTQSALLPELPSRSAQLVCLDNFLSDRQEEQFDNPAVGLSAANLAYVIYTSGSTGKPKGVAVSHGALTNLLCSVQQQPGLAAHDVLLSVTTLLCPIGGIAVNCVLTIRILLTIVKKII